jgi:hypothetical protein
MPVKMFSRAPGWRPLVRILCNGNKNEIRVVTKYELDAIMVFVHIWRSVPLMGTHTYVAVYFAS